MKVKKIFFIDRIEQKQLNRGDYYIVEDLPHFELEDGRIFYGHKGYGELTEIWWGEFETLEEKEAKAQLAKEEDGNG